MGAFGTMLAALALGRLFDARGRELVYLATAGAVIGLTVYGTLALWIQIQILIPLIAAEIEWYRTGGMRNLSVEREPYQLTVVRVQPDHDVWLGEWPKWQLDALARGLKVDQTFTHRRWVVRANTFRRAEFERLQSVFMARGLARRRGNSIELTDLGMDWVKEYGNDKTY